MNHSKSNTNHKSSLPQSLRDCGAGTDECDLNFLTFKQLIDASDVDIGWCVDQIFPRQSVCTIAGHPGIGKSWLLSDLAISVTCGQLWLERFPCIQGPVIYIDAENGIQLLRNRFTRLLIGRSLSAELPGARFLVGNELDLLNPEQFSLLSRFVSIVNPVLVVIDPLLKAHSGDENSATDMVRVSKALRTLARVGDCCVVVVDHQKKNTNQYQKSLQNLRGSSEKLANLDSMLSVAKANKGTELVIRIKHEKSRYVREHPPFECRIIDLNNKAIKLIFDKNIGNRQDNKMVSEYTRSAIIEYLEENPRKQRNDIIAHCTDCGISRNSVDSNLKQLVNELYVLVEKKKKVGRGPSPLLYWLNPEKPKGNENIQLSLSLDLPKSQQPKVKDDE